MYDFAIVGGGIVGLSTGMALMERYPNARITILEKENEWAKHQTGNNSGVIHSGIYYKPGSLKARYATEGNRSIIEFCQKHHISHDVCGKVIVATNKKEIPLLKNLHERGLQNGLNIERIGPERLKEIEPHVHGLEAIHVPMAGIVNYKQVCQAFADLLMKQGHDLHLGTTVQHIHEHQEKVIIDTNKGTFHAKHIVNCSGLHSDRITKKAGVDTNLKIIPFRGEYYKLKPEKEYLVKNLIYPVPNPEFPFLGVHFTRMIGGGIEAGPNAVLSYKREGYKKTDINVRDLSETLSYRGFWRLARKYWKVGMEEMYRSYSKRAFVKQLQQLIPDIQENDLITGPAGVRAQALLPNGQLVDDFHIIKGKRSIHICNAPSPAATASIEIGKGIVEHISEQVDPSITTTA